MKKQYPEALYLGSADGAKNNWHFLEQHTSRQLIDFFHVTEYLSEVTQVAFPGKTDKPKCEVWLHDRCKQLKHQAGAVDNLITEMETFAKRTQLSKTVKENLTAAQTYFANNHQRMNYADHVAQDCR